MRGGFYRARFALVVCAGRATELADLLSDRRLGVETGGFIPAAELGVDTPDVHGFAPSPWRTLRCVLSPDEVRPDEVFLDIGAGKGRIVIAAALEYGFRRVVGIEISPDLVTAARRNVDLLRHRIGARDVVILAGDATAEVADDVTVIYAYDPFEGHLCDQLVEQVLFSLNRRPRQMRVITRNPVGLEDALLLTGRARVVRRARGILRDRHWGLPEVVMFELT